MEFLSDRVRHFLTSFDLEPYLSHFDIVLSLHKRSPISFNVAHTDKNIVFYYSSAEVTRLIASSPPIFGAQTQLTSAKCKQMVFVSGQGFGVFVGQPITLKYQIKIIEMTKNSLVGIDQLALLNTPETHNNFESQRVSESRMPKVGWQSTADRSVIRLTLRRSLKVLQCITSSQHFSPEVLVEFLHTQINQLNNVLPGKLLKIENQTKQINKKTDFDAKVVFEEFIQNDEFQHAPYFKNHSCGDQKSQQF